MSHQEDEKHLMLVESGLLKGSWLEVSDISDGIAVIRKKRKHQMEFPGFLCY